MNNIINRMLQNIVTSILTIYIITIPVIAQTQSTACQDTGVVIGFFNGVNNTHIQANNSLLMLKNIHGSRTQQDEPIRYELLYNYTNGFEDFVETFEQRLLEHEGLLEGRFELFFEAIRGEGPWWQTIINTVSSSMELFESLVGWHKAKTINELTSLFSTPPTEVNYLEHRTRINNWVLEGKKLLFVAHSQGNLFVNAAYDYALEQTSSESVSVVHIAPASPKLNGPHTLANLDLVINGLRLTGNVVPNTNNIPGYLLRPAGVNGKKDILGHGLMEIYINPSLEVSNRIKSHINNALNTLIAPPVHASQGFFTTTLTWDGTGDVDLHIFEPNGSHVYYAQPRGTTGYLDIDNTKANGPEHYFASCDINKLQTGIYRVSIANYFRADNKTATVQVSSWKDGALGTKSVVLGKQTGSNPSITLFNVNVDINQNTNSYEITIK